MVSYQFSYPTLASVSDDTLSKLRAIFPEKMIVAALDIIDRTNGTNSYLQLKVTLTLNNRSGTFLYTLGPLGIPSRGFNRQLYCLSRPPECQGASLVHLSGVLVFCSDARHPHNGSLD